MDWIIHGAAKSQTWLSDFDFIQDSTGNIKVFLISKLTVAEAWERGQGSGMGIQSRNREIHQELSAVHGPGKG